MPLALANGTPEDVARFVELEVLAMGPSPLIAVLFPRSTETAVQAKFAEQMRTDMREDTTVRFMKVIDTDNDGEIVAFAKWNVYIKERPRSEWDTPVSTDFGAEANQEACTAFFGKVFSERKRLLQGKPHCLLSFLDTDPKHQRRGAGGMLVKWGTDIADREGITAHLDASPDGYGLYKKHGFEDNLSWDFDMEPWGKRGAARTVWMIRQPMRA